MENEDLVVWLRRKLLPRLDEFKIEGYEGVALHSSSIMIAANQAVADMFGYELDDITGMNAWVFFSSKSADVIMKHLFEKSRAPYTVIGVKKDKTEFEVEIKGLDFEIEGEPVRVVALKNEKQLIIKRSLF